MRYTVLFCMVVFGFRIIFWLVSSTHDPSKRPKHWLDMDELSEDTNELNGVGGSNYDENLLIGMIKNESEQILRNEGYAKHAFNDLISVRLGHHRLIPDTRHNMCKSLIYSHDLPSASVIICFHNEAWSTLFRTVHSVLDRTPHYLLHEIILVDDFSTEEYLKDALDHYVKQLSKVLIVHSTRREGLIRGRALGASKASGDVLVFLDSHCEVNVNWLPPLLEPISKNLQTVVCPIIDIINSDTFQYSPSPLVKGGFNWGLHFQWEPISSSTFTQEEDFVKPIKSATMAGGLFAIDKKYFNTLGKYDGGMDIWGGENLEISFRIWMCGGELNIVPCSRVGHVFRARRPYGSDGKGDTMSYNSMRVAEVWMDEYKKYYYDTRKDLKGKYFGDISHRLALRHKLKCRSFKWYLYNIYPEIDIPSERKGSSLLWRRSSLKQTKILREGKLRNYHGFCLDVPANSVEKGIVLVLRLCNEVRQKNTWSYSDVDQLKLRDRFCLDVKKPYNPRLMKCHEGGGTQQWKLLNKSQALYNPASGTCLSQSSHNKAIMAICNTSDLSQKWVFQVDLFKNQINSL